MMILSQKESMHHKEPPKYNPSRSSSPICSPKNGTDNVETIRDIDASTVTSKPPLTITRLNTDKIHKHEEENKLLIANATRSSGPSSNSTRCFGFRPDTFPLDDLDNSSLTSFRAKLHERNLKDEESFNVKSNRRFHFMDKCRPLTTLKCTSTVLHKTANNPNETCYKDCYITSIGTFCFSRDLKEIVDKYVHTTSDGGVIAVTKHILIPRLKTVSMTATFHTPYRKRLRAKLPLLERIALPSLDILPRNVFDANRTRDEVMANCCTANSNKTEKPHSECSLLGWESDQAITIPCDSYTIERGMGDCPNVDATQFEESVESIVRTRSEGEENQEEILKYNSEEQDEDNKARLVNGFISTDFVEPNIHSSESKFELGSLFLNKYVSDGQCGNNSTDICTEKTKLQIHDVLNAQNKQSLPHENVQNGNHSIHYTEMSDNGYEITAMASASNASNLDEIMCSAIGLDDGNNTFIDTFSPISVSTRIAQLRDDHEVVQMQPQTPGELCGQSLKESDPSEMALEVNGSNRFSRNSLRHSPRIQSCQNADKVDILAGSNDNLKEDVCSKQTHTLLSPIPSEHEYFDVSKTDPQRSNVALEYRCSPVISEREETKTDDVMVFANDLEESYCDHNFNFTISDDTVADAADDNDDDNNCGNGFDIVGYERSHRIDADKERQMHHMKEASNTFSSNHASDLSKPRANSARMNRRRSPLSRRTSPNRTIACDGRNTDECTTLSRPGDKHSNLSDKKDETFITEGRTFCEDALPFKKKVEEILEREKNMLGELNRRKIDEDQVLNSEIKETLMTISEENQETLLCMGEITNSPSLVNRYLWLANEDNVPDWAREGCAMYHSVRLSEKPKPQPKTETMRPKTRAITSDRLVALPTRLQNVAKAKRERVNTLRWEAEMIKFLRHTCVDNLITFHDNRIDCDDSVNNINFSSKSNSSVDFEEGTCLQNPEKGVKKDEMRDIVSNCNLPMSLDGHNSFALSVSDEPIILRNQAIDISNTNQEEDKNANLEAPKTKLIDTHTKKENNLSRQTSTKEYLKVPENSSQILKHQYTNMSMSNPCSPKMLTAKELLEQNEQIIRKYKSNEFLLPPIKSRHCPNALLQQTSRENSPLTLASMNACHGSLSLNSGISSISNRQQNGNYLPISPITLSESSKTQDGNDSFASLSTTDIGTLCTNEEDESCISESCKNDDHCETNSSKSSSEYSCYVAKSHHSLSMQPDDECGSARQKIFKQSRKHSLDLTKENITEKKTYHSLKYISTDNSQHIMGLTDSAKHATVLESYSGKLDMNLYINSHLTPTSIVVRNPDDEECLSTESHSSVSINRTQDDLSLDHNTKVSQKEKKKKEEEQYYLQNNECKDRFEKNEVNILNKKTKQQKEDEQDTRIESNETQSNLKTDKNVYGVGLQTLQYSISLLELSHKPLSVNGQNKQSRVEVSTPSLIHKDNRPAPRLSLPSILDRAVPNDVHNNFISCAKPSMSRTSNRLNSPKLYSDVDTHLHLEENKICPSTEKALVNGDSSIGFGDREEKIADFAKLCIDDENLCDSSFSNHAYLPTTTDTTLASNGSTIEAGLTHNEECPPNLSEKNNDDQNSQTGAQTRFHEKGRFKLADHACQESVTGETMDNDACLKARWDFQRFDSFNVLVTGKKNPLATNQTGIDYPGIATTNDECSNRGDTDIVCSDNTGDVIFENHSIGTIHYSKQHMLKPNSSSMCHHLTTRKGQGCNARMPWQEPSLPTHKELPALSLEGQRFQVSQKRGKGETQSKQSRSRLPMLHSKHENQKKLIRNQTIRSNMDIVRPIKHHPNSEKNAIEDITQKHNIIYSVCHKCLVSS